MTDKMNSWIDGNALDSDDLMDTISNDRFVKFTNIGASANEVLVFSNNIWQAGTKRTTDAGSSYSTVTEIRELSEVSRETSSKAVSSNDSGNYIKYTTDSGATWTSAVNPSNVSILHGISFVSDDMCVLFGEATSGVGVWYSTDGGATWTQAGTGPQYVRSGDMETDSIGYLSDSSGNIYKTDVAGTPDVDHWTDTTDNITTGSNAVCKTIDSDNVIFLQGIGSDASQFEIDHYNNSTNTVTNILSTAIGNNFISKVIKSSGNNFYFSMISFGDVATFAGIQYTYSQIAEVKLFKTPDGITWEIMSLPGLRSSSDFGITNSVFTPKYPLTSIGITTNNKLLYAESDVLYELKLRDDVS